MKVKKLCILAILLTILFSIVGCSKNNVNKNTVSFSDAKIYLYGEKHGIEKIMKKELQKWHEHYHKDGIRHLFIESPYFSGEFLNIWMKSDSDEILDALYDDLEGTKAHVPFYKTFYKTIKKECPETIFHGTDVGHQFFSTGKRFIEYLENNNLENTEQYKLTQQAIEQGEYFYDSQDDVYRENKMTENFIRAYDALGEIKIMGIYGGSHTGLFDMDYTGKVPTMANQLREHYGDIIYSENLY
ncbi:MAG: hypothetical protein GX337_08005 [Christensenellaceae bacterium]|nr:hypothetical protein [Christensenellaceae bacterium]